ncbi:uncharacterized protein CELE_R01H2.8 [Caenorhabditis elegans]|uniref:Uncharacterized protein n=1 Tax=Caenorhabditis elegans TaxID=6239 RepID=A0T4E7_CAEEL|nr:Uncharacterized protein CELE_R01H2.8 [Caenorhabditis elegans]CCD69289.1 Uncharacterized protein CELE_R01H2.8 [Caenorhabditis elegans]|eukprot:NP_001076644.1 Uncharacterized protein CELE_R01H2.8 [Caenorhabditis elegans]
MSSTLQNDFLTDLGKTNLDKEAENLVTLIFLIVIFTIFALAVIGAILIGCLKPQWFRLNIYQDPVPKMADFSCINVCIPCNSCSLRQLLNGCCPRLHLKQRFNFITTCCDRPGPEKLNLVCCVV